MERYEYRILTLSPVMVNTVSLEHQLNELGALGWYVLHSNPDYILLERPLGYRYDDEEEDDSDDYRGEE